MSNSIDAFDEAAALFDVLLADSAIDALDALLADSGVAEGVPPAGATEGEMSGDSQKLKSYADLVKKVPLLRSLTEEEQLKIAALLKPKEFEDGENIINQGEEGDCMYFIQSGEVRSLRTPGMRAAGGPRRGRWARSTCDAEPAAALGSRARLAAFCPTPNAAGATRPRKARPFSPLPVPCTLR